jgi:DNA-binding NtrC family response regulator
MKKDVTELKKMFVEILQNPNLGVQNQSYLNDLKDFKSKENLQPALMQSGSGPTMAGQSVVLHDDTIHHHEVVEESLNIIDREKELIEKALKKHKGKRKDAALDLGISERTLYRKLKDYDIKE